MRDVLCALIFGRNVAVEPREASYDRGVGLMSAGGVDASGAMVAAGAAWDYPEYDRDLDTPAFEQGARSAHLGLPVDSASVPP